MKIATRELPKIVELLFVGKQPHFVVLIYEQYARLAVAGSAAGAPDTVAVLDFAGEHLFVVVGFDEYRAFLGKFVVEGRIDEDRYLTKYDDIRLAVAAGLLKNGRNTISDRVISSGGRFACRRRTHSAADAREGRWNTCEWPTSWQRGIFRPRAGMC